MDHGYADAGRDAVQRVERPAGVAALEDLQAPRQRRDSPVQFLIEVVAEPAYRLCQHDSRRDRITEGRQRNAAATARDPRANAAERHRSPDAKAAVPNPQCGKESSAVVAEVRWPVGHDVI